MVLKQLGYVKTDPTKIYVDSILKLKIMNTNITTEQTHHIDICFFVIQDWCEVGDIIMKHFPGITNTPDDHARPLGYVTCNPLLVCNGMLYLNYKSQSYICSYI